MEDGGREKGLGAGPHPGKGHRATELPPPWRPWRKPHFICTPLGAREEHQQGLGPDRPQDLVGEEEEGKERK